jgi:tetratricopeptide (TPR) repeat protein
MPADALRLCVALWPFWLRRIDLEEAHHRFADVLAAVPEPTALRAEALLAGAALALRAGRLALGDEYARESLALAQRGGDVRAHWRALHYLGGSAISNDDLEAAVSWFEQALELARRERLPAAAALCIYSLGVARERLGDLVRAEQLVAEGVEGFRAVRPTCSSGSATSSSRKARFSQRARAWSGRWSCGAGWETGGASAWLSPASASSVSSPATSITRRRNSPRHVTSFVAREIAGA